MFASYLVLSVFVVCLYICLLFISVRFFYIITRNDEYIRLYYNTKADNYFTTEAVSRIILDLQRGKAADIDGLTAEHLQYGHPVVSVLLAKLFALIALSRCFPAGFKRSYIVPIPKTNDCKSKALNCEDFRGIAISPILSKVFENCLLTQLQAFVNSNDNQFGFKKGIGCPHAIYTVCTVTDRWISQGFTVNL